MQHLHGPRAAALIRRHLIAQKLVEYRMPVTGRELGDVYEDLRLSREWGDEAESPAVVPLGEAAMNSHADPVRLTDATCTENPVRRQSCTGLSTAVGDYIMICPFLSLFGIP